MAGATAVGALVGITANVTVVGQTTAGATTASLTTAGAMVAGTMVMVAREVTTTTNTTITDAVVGTDNNFGFRRQRRYCCSQLWRH